MGAQLNIKDERTVTIARDLARQLGKSVTATIREALEEKAQIRVKAKEDYIARVTALIDDIRSEMPEDVKKMTSKQIMDSIYDDDEPDGFAR